MVDTDRWLHMKPKLELGCLRPEPPEDLLADGPHPPQRSDILYIHAGLNVLVCAHKYVL